MEATASDIADRVGEAMMARDHAARALGIRLEEIRPGYARMSMRVRPDMLNGHAVCHGGFTFALADTAFAYACNAANEATVAAAAEIAFTAPVRLEDELVAIAAERIQMGRSGIFDVEVTERASGRLVALFRGRSHRTGGPVLAPTEPL